ncbi:MAG TPA: FxsA family protein, partial [Nakamurella sp.]
LLLLLGGFVLGLALIGRGGREAMAAVNQAARSRTMADDAVTGGFLTVVAGVLLLIPGFISDLAAVALLLPPVRALARRRMQARASRSSAQVRVVNLGTMPAGTWAGAPVGTWAGAGRGPVVDGTVVEGSVVEDTVVEDTVVDVTPDDGPSTAPRGSLEQRRPGEHPAA